MSQDYVGFILKTRKKTICQQGKKTKTKNIVSEHKSLLTNVLIKSFFNLFSSKEY